VLHASNNVVVASTTAIAIQYHGRGGARGGGGR
jgi:hypothetical protein